MFEPTNQRAAARRNRWRYLPVLLYTSVLCLVVLLASNAWLLKEVERLRREVSACREAVSALDDRLFQLAIAVDEFTRPAPALPQEFERTPE